VKGILGTLQGAGFEAYLVGGAVRDLWLGITPKDFDLASGATPEEVERLFPRTEGVGRQFGIMVVVTEGGPVELARFRADAEYKNGRHPEGVVFSSPEEDAKRRDFTINGLFYDTRKGEILDYVGGLDDLERRRIRCVGSAELRFEEDALRMLRAVRFHAQLAPSGFTLDPSLLGSIRKQARRLELVSRERITQELEKIFLSQGPSVGTFDLVLCGLWEEVFGTAPPNAAVHANFDALGDYFITIAARRPELPLFLAALAQWLPGWNPEKSFVLSKESKAVLKAVPRLAGKLESYSSLPRAGKKLLLVAPFALEAIAILHVNGEESLRDLLEEALADRERWLKAGLLDPPPLLTGADLVALGHKPGPRFKALLEEIRLAQLNEEIDTREAALKRLGRQ
jgi:tRNA nucleotidyltransferase/poly(A) polymerase